MQQNPYQSPAGIEEAKNSNVRSVVGWLLLAIGSLLVLRMLWLGWYWWPLREEEVSRVIVLSIVGTLFALLGTWLRFRSKLFLFLALGLLGSLLLLLILA